MIPLGPVHNRWMMWTNHKRNKINTRTQITLTFCCSLFFLLWFVLLHLRSGKGVLSRSLSLDCSSILNTLIVVRIVTSSELDSSLLLLYVHRMYHTSPQCKTRLQSCSASEPLPHSRACPSLAMCLCHMLSLLPVVKD